MSRLSRYMRAIIDPITHISSIPDDVCVQHVLRNEPLTEVITNDLGNNNQLQSTIIIARLNAPSSVKAAVWQWDPMGSAWKFYGKLTIAQNVADNYNSARHVNGMLQIENSTISTTNATLSGTCNAIVYEGSPSELFSTIAPYPTAQQSSPFTPKLIFEKILAQTSNPLDKVGNVKVSTGVAMRALPYSFNLPFARLDDNDPSYGAMIPVGRSTISDGTQDLIYRTEFKPDNTQDLHSGYIGGMNYDNFDGPMTVKFAFTFSGQLSNFLIDIMDPLGEVFIVYQADVNTTTGNYFTTDSAEITIPFLERPVAAVRFYVTTVATVRFNELNVDMVSYNGNMPGVTWPIAVALLDGMPFGSQTSISGSFGLELIPNPQLKQNLPTMYMHYDPQELSYVKHIMANRNELGLRSVLPLNMVEQDKATNKPVYELDETAEAFSWGSLLEGIKAVAVPALKTLFPDWSRVIDSGATFVDDLKSKVGFAAAGSYALDSIPEEDQTAYAMDFGFDMIQPLSTMSINERGDISGKNPIMEPTQILDLTKAGVKTPVVLFPVVVMSKGRPIKNCMYACVPGDFRDYLPESVSGDKVECGTNVIFGWSQTINSMNFFFQLEKWENMSFTLLPIRYATTGLLAIPTEAPTLKGRSCEAAIYAVALMMKDNMPFTVYQPLTGGITGSQGNVLLLPNIIYDVKRSYCNVIGLKLTGCDKHTGAQKLEPLIRGLQPLDNKATCAVYYNNYPLTGDETACAADEANFSLADLGKLLIGFKNDVDKRFKEMDERIADKNKMPEAPKPKDRRPPPAAENPPFLEPVKYGFDDSSSEEDEQVYEPRRRPRREASEVRFRERSQSVGRYDRDDVIQLIDQLNENGMPWSQMFNMLSKASIGKEKGPSEEEAKEASRIRRFESLQVSLPNLSWDWFAANNYKGPSPIQINYFKVNKRWPKPGTLLDENEYKSVGKGMGVIDLDIPDAVVAYARENFEGAELQNKFMKMACSNSTALKTFGYNWLDLLAVYVQTHKKMPDAAALKTILDKLVKPARGKDVIPGLGNWFSMDKKATPPTRARSRSRYLYTEETEEQPEPKLTRPEKTKPSAGAKGGTKLSRMARNAEYSEVD